MLKKRFHSHHRNLASIDLSWLLNLNIKGIILDLDNTLISEDDRYLSPGGEAWIKQAQAAEIKFYILSNGKRRYRVEYWSHRLQIPAKHRARKPFPFSFRQALSKMQLHPQQVIVIGDSLHTDITGAWLTGLPSIQVASLPHPPRWWEHLFGHWVQKAYPDQIELLPFDDSDYHS